MSAAKPWRDIGSHLERFLYGWTVGTFYAIPLAAGAFLAHGSPGLALLMVPFWFSVRWMRNDMRDDIEWNRQHGVYSTPDNDGGDS